ncbi:12880_t:CDS:2, partial [Funneliformis geosporum]
FDKQVEEGFQYVTDPKTGDLIEMEFMELKSKVILLNGSSSVGKTSLVKAIQYLSEEPWLTFGIDDCLDAMPDKYVGEGKKAAEGFHFVSSFDKEGFPITEVKTGSYGERVSSLVPKIVELAVDNGFNVIVDELSGLEQTPSKQLDEESLDKLTERFVRHLPDILEKSKLSSVEKLPYMTMMR